MKEMKMEQSQRAIGEAIQKLIEEEIDKERMEKVTNKKLPEILKNKAIQMKKEGHKYWKIKNDKINIAIKQNRIVIKINTKLKITDIL